MTRISKRLIREELESIIEKIDEIKAEAWRRGVKDGAYVELGDACEHIRESIRNLK